jgi:hypothetical protein
MAVKEMVTEAKLKKITLRSIALMQYVINKYEVEDMNGFTCPFHKALAKELDDLGQLTWCWK